MSFYKVRSYIPKPKANTEPKAEEKRGLFGKKTEMVIGDVTSYVHESHVGVSSDGSFDLKNIPSEWKTMFKASGIKKKDLMANPDLTSKVLKIMQDSGGNVPPPPPNKPKGPKPPIAPKRPSMSHGIGESDVTVVDTPSVAEPPPVPSKSTQPVAPPRVAPRAPPAPERTERTSAPPPPVRSKPAPPMPPPLSSTSSVPPPVTKTALPGPPRIDLLSSIQSFNKNELKKSEPEAASSGSPKGLMNAIQGFNKTNLKTAVATAPNPEEKKRVSTGPGNMYDQLTMAIQQIRANVQLNEDSDEGSDWSDS